MDSTSQSERHQLALLGVTSALRGLLAEAARGEVLARHRVGIVLRDLMRSPRTYGQHCIERVGVELGFAPSTLYRYAAVAECWCSMDILAQSAKTNRFGHPLTWSHFLVLSKVSESTLRQTLLDTCLAEAWSSRELALRVAALVERRVTHETSEGLDSVREALEDGIESAIRATTGVRVLADSLEAPFADVTGESNGDLLSRAIAAMEELRSRAELILTQLERTQRGSVSRLRWPSAAAPTRPSDDEDPGDLSEERISIVFGARRDQQS